MADYVVGVDESGTGALAGPFTVCAFAGQAAAERWISKAGARDSKRLSAQRRFKLRADLSACAEIVAVEVVPPDYKDQRVVWRSAVIRAVTRCLDVLGPNAARAEVFIDGKRDRTLDDYLFEYRITPFYVVGGDDLIPQISAASIFAKCERTELMQQHHLTYPVYGWERNDGYGTRDHLAAIEKHGICGLHRRCKPLLPYFHQP